MTPPPAPALGLAAQPTFLVNAPPAPNRTGAWGGPTVQGRPRPWPRLGRDNHGVACQQRNPGLGRAFGVRKENAGVSVMKGLVAWFLGVPIVVIILLYVTGIF